MAFIVYESSGKVTAIYHDLDTIEGLTGITVETVPVPESNGLVPVLKVNLEDDTLYYDYESPADSMETTVSLLKAQINAQTERSDFMEDVIAELALQVYS